MKKDYENNTATNKRDQELMNKTYGLCKKPSNHKGITPSDCGKCWNIKFAKEKAIDLVS